MGKSGPRILCIGNGAREHAILWKLRQDDPSAQLFITRGNGGTGALAQPLPLDPNDISALAGWAGANNIDLTVVGPEAPLADGIVDVFVRAQLPIFGPTKQAAALESSKAFAKQMMREANIPTAAFATFTDLHEAERFIQQHTAPIVVKASGLAAGKGAVVCETGAEAIEVAREMLTGGAFGTAGREIVIEEFMEGEELSVIALADGENAVPLVPAQDHKRIGEGDTGANTGGMGAYAPVGIATPELLDRIQREILRPTLAALKERGRTFRGVLYAGLMITKEGPRVVEFNARFGDPETEVLLPLLASSLLEPMLAIARGEQFTGPLEQRSGAALTTVLAAGGYPGVPEKGKVLNVPEWIADASDLLVFHAGTRIDGDQVVSSGGRVLAVTALAPTLAAAAARSREAAQAIHFEGKQFRRDIGWRELQRGVPASA